MKRLIVYFGYLFSKLFWADIWKMKVLVTEKKHFRRLLMAVMEYRLYKDNCSYIGPFSKFDNKPVFPHGIHDIFISSEKIM